MKRGDEKTTEGGTRSASASGVSEYNQQALRKARRRVWARRAPRVILVLLVVGITTAFAMSYLANMPRERFARGYKYLERVWLGAETVAEMTRLKLAAEPEDLKNTRLPVAEIYIKGKRLDRLTEALPNTDVSPEKAKIKLGDKSFSGKVRFRGDSINHWAYPNRSWRIELKDGDFYRGMQHVNLNVPRVETQMANWLGYRLAKDMGGLIAPHAENVHFRLNRQFDGVRLLLEQPNQDMLRRRYFPPGKIFVGDIGSEQIYGGVPRKLLYSDPTGWGVRAPGNDISRDEIEDLIATLRRDEDPYAFYDAFRSLVDVEALTKYMALLELVGSVHVDETHNGKLYFHPHLGRFQPIVWDTVAYMWGNAFDLDIGVNRLFRVVLQNPALRAMKDRHLWNAVYGEQVGGNALDAKSIVEKIEQEAERLRPDMYAFAFKLHANDKGIRHLSNRDFDEAVEQLKQTVRDRDEKIRTHLGPTEASYTLSSVGAGEHTLLVRVASPVGAQLESVRLSSASPLKQAPRLVREIPLEGGRLAETVAVPAVRSEDGSYRVVLGDHLFSKRRFVKRKAAEVVPATYRYRILGLPSTAQVELEATHPFSGKKVVIPAASGEEIAGDAGSKPFASWWDPETFAAGEEVRWSGTVRLQQSRVFGPRDSLVVAAGTELLLGEGVSLYLNGTSVQFEGSESRPITVRSAVEGKRWGTIALRDVPKGEFRHVKLSGGTFDTFDHVRYEGLLAVHGGEVLAEYLETEGNYLSAKSGRLTIRNSTVRSPFPFVVKAENAIVREIEVNHERTPALHSRALLTEPGVGTPKRAEREYKFSVRSADGSERDLMDVAQAIRSALERRGSDRSVWNAPRLVDGDYYVDDDAEDFLFRDVYFDTEEGLAYKNSISYRYRNRYKSWKRYKKHIKDQDWPELWPYRLEFQAKVDRKELGGGFSTVQEARFEFRDASSPFSPTKRPPDAPWRESEFLRYFESGRYQGMTTYPAQEVMRVLSDQFEGETLEFQPELVLVTERFRQHLNIPSQFGSGPNPEQSFIISLDKSRVYEGKRYLQYLQDEYQGIKYTRKPASLGAIVEIEVEFERNVSDVLDKKIAVTEGEERAQLQAVRDAFLRDQEAIMLVVKEELDNEGLLVSHANKSKYVQAYELARLGSQ
ncbi:CotH kinase family protein [bacterium]|nr:CotH kinase family protein [bacterium]